MIWRRLLIYSATILLILSALLVISFSTLVRKIAENQLQKAGARQVSIDDIDLNLFKGEFRLQGLRIYHNAQQQIRLQTLVIGFSLQPLLKNQIKLSSIKVDGLQVYAEQTAKGQWQYGLANLVAEQTPQADIAQDSGQHWLFNLQYLSVNQAQVFLHKQTLSAAVKLDLNLQLEEVSADSRGMVSIDALQVSELTLCRVEHTLLGFAKLQLKDIQYQQAMLRLQQFRLDSLAINIKRLPDQSFYLIDDLQKLAAIDNVGNSPTVDKALHWSVGSIEFAGDNRLYIQDNSVKPTVELNMVLQQFSIGGLNSQQADAQTAINVKMATDNYDSIALSGWISPLLAEPALDIQLDIERLNIARFSPYVVDAIGYRANTGQLNLQNQTRIRARQLNSQSGIRLNKFTILADESPAAIEKAKAFESDIRIPLNLALDLIRDKNADVKLDIPINGTLDDPHFQVSDVIRKATSKALAEASITYLKWTLQPWGALWMLTEKVSKQAGKIEFDAIEFAPGSAVLSIELQPYFKKLAELLKNKDNLRLNLCSVSTGQDTPLIDDVNALARQRVDTLKQQLVESYQINSERLFDCAIRHDKSIDIVPHIAVTL